MKYLIIIALLLLPVGAWGQAAITGPSPVVPEWVKHSMGVSPFMVNDGPDNRIRQWAASGEICRVLGHSYELPITRKELTGMDGMTVLYREVNTRKCRMCGKVETLFEEWR